MVGVGVGSVSGSGDGDSRSSVSRHETKLGNRAMIITNIPREKTAKAICRPTASQLTSHRNMATRRRALYLPLLVTLIF